MKRTIAYTTGALLAIFASGAMAQTAPSEEPQTPAVSTPDDKNPKAPVPGENSFTEAQATERLTEGGYTGVTNLKLGEDGIWRADATKDGQPIKLMLDFQGNITTE